MARSIGKPSIAGEIRPSAKLGALCSAENSRVSATGIALAIRMLPHRWSGSIMDARTATVPFFQEVYESFNR